MSARFLPFLLLWFAAFPARAAEPWRVFSGGFSSRWMTVGHHGHDQPSCAETPPPVAEGQVVFPGSDCDSADFARGNLDNSIGFRAGAERVFWRAGAVHFVGGAESAVSYTEYNLSQRDFALWTASLFGGAEVDLGPARVGARWGFGGHATSDARSAGAARFTEVHATIPLQRRAAIRISRRNVDLGPSAVETSVMFVSGGRAGWVLPWEFSTATGMSTPGAGLGGDRKLRRTAFTRVGALRALPFAGLDLEMTWDATAHESSMPTTFLGYDGNYRSKTIDAYGFGLSRTKELTGRVGVRYGTGFVVADWRDEHQLLTRDGAELRAGVEAGAQWNAALRAGLDSRLAIEISAQKIYWPRIDLSEARVGVGVVLRR